MTTSKLRGAKGSLRASATTRRTSAGAGGQVQELEVRAHRQRAAPGRLPQPGEDVAGPAADVEDARARGAAQEGDAPPT